MTAILAAGLLFFACSGTTSSGGGGNTDDPDNGGGGNVDNPIDGGDGAGTVQTPTAADVSNASVNIVKSEGLFNSAYIIFEQVEGAVYEVLADDVKIDDALIRYYDEYVYHEYDESNSTWTKKSLTKVCRADALGLKAGSHTLKVCAVVGTQNKSEYSSATMTVADKDRSGFAFTGSSIPGAYASDGTLKSNAIVLYVTGDTAKTVTYTQVKGTNATANATYTGLQNVLSEASLKKLSVPLCIRIIGTITKDQMDNLLSSEEGLQIKNTTDSGITIEGVGHDASVYGFGFLIRAAKYVELCNLGVYYFMDDGISVDTDNSYLWIHNNDISYGTPGSDSDQIKGDGSLDFKKSTYSTISYNHYWDSGKCNLLDASADKSVDKKDSSNYLSYHHNWYDHSDSRHPRIRNATAVHVYNNYYDGNSKYGIGVTSGSSCFAESNYFRNAHDPMMSSLQGTDARAAKGTFSGEEGGTIKAYGNVFDGKNTNGVKFQFVTNKYDYTNNTDATGISLSDIDAYEVDSRDEKVPDTVKTKSGSHTYSNFDTTLGLKGLGLAAVPSDAETAKSYVVKYAGRYQSDFAYNFDNAKDDADYNLNSELQALVVNYENKLTAVQGLASSGSGGSSGGDSGEPTGSGTSDPVSGGTTDSGSTDVPTGSAVVALVVNGAVAPSDSRVTASGSVNAKESNGAITITYGGTEYTTMKMESSSSITVKATAGATITVVGSLPSGKQSCFKLNGTAVKLDAKTTAVTTFEQTFTSTGNDVITKGDTASIGVIVISE